MEENLEANSETNKEMTVENDKPNFEEIKKPKSEDVINVNENNPSSENNSAPKVDKKNESPEKYKIRAPTCQYTRRCVQNSGANIFGFHPKVDIP